MTPPFRKAMRWSAVIHGVFIALLFLLPWFFRPRRSPPRETVTLVELRDAPPRAMPQSVPVERIAPPPAPDPPPVPEPAPDPPPARREIQVSTQRVYRAAERPAPRQRPPDPNRLRELLDPGPPPPAGVAAADTLPSWYYDDVRRRLHEAWEQPGGLQAGLATRVVLRVARNGQVTGSDLTQSSGVPAMDDSVMRAVRAVTTLPALPASFRKTRADITVTFELSGTAGAAILSTGR